MSEARAEAGDKPRILVVEDEAHLAAALKLNFELDAYSVAVAGTAREAALCLLQAEFDVIILDVMLPDISGFAFCRTLREAGNFTPVIMLTARTASTDRITGLDVGADDYLPKPFELSELLARVRSLLRRRKWERHQPPGPGDVLQFGAVRVDFSSYEVTVNGVPLKLTQLELDLLRYFATHVGRVISREELLEKVWKLRNYPNTRTVDNFIVRLRRYFEPDVTHPAYFLSVRGSGYRFVVPSPGL